MNKETIIAIGLGLLLGVVVAVGAVYVTVRHQREQNSQIGANDKKNAAQIKPTSIPPTVVVMPSIELDTPTSGTVTSASTIKIAGTAAAHALIIIQSPVQTKVKKFDTGAFTFDFPLALGENTITVSSYPEHSTIPVQKHLFIYRII